MYQSFAARSSRCSRTVCLAATLFAVYSYFLSSPALATPVPLTGAAMVSVGGGFSCALMTSGTVKCWGANRDGSVGDGSFNNSAYAVTAVGLTNVVQISSNAAHACALIAGGTVACWGLGENGELGYPSFESSVPTKVAGLTGVVSVAAGGNLSCAAVGAGPVECWGSDQNGELGNSSGLKSVNPVPVGVANATKVVAGADHACALLVDETVKCWGVNSSGELGNGTTSNTGLPGLVVGLSGVRDITASAGHTCALIQDGSIKCWGSNGEGELGVASPSASPIPVTVPGLVNVKAVGAGASHTCAVIETGAVFCWGANDVGQLGNGITTYDNGPYPSYVASLAGMNVTQLSVGFGVTCVVLDSNQVECWGAGSGGALGNGLLGYVSTPSIVSGLPSIQSIALGEEEGCALSSAGSVYCWGDDRPFNQGDLAAANDARPMLVSGIANVKGVATGTGFACGLLETGQVECWGDNGFGILGNGGYTSSATPVLVNGVANAIQIASFSDHVCSLISNGSVICWGNGIGAVPQTITGISTASSISVGDGFSCALLAGGEIKCWGRNIVGELGNGGTLDSTAPVDVIGITNATALSSSFDSSCAILADKTIKCWGGNYLGQLVSSGQITSTPQLVAGVSGATAVAAGGLHACALTSTGTFCWGDNSYGELGLGYTSNQIPPTHVPNLDGVQSIKAGEEFTCSLSAGTVSCWGNNYQGEVANGTFGYFLSPQTVLCGSCTSTTISSSDISSPLGASIAFTAVVTGGSNVTGSVNFEDAGVAFCVAQVSNVGTATCQVNSLNIGQHTITASYSGDANNDASSSTSIAQIVHHAGGFVALLPARILDTRSGTTTVDGQSAGLGAVPAGSYVNLSATGRGGIPSNGVMAVVLNLTATNASAPSYITAWPTGAAKPLTSSVNILPGQAAPNLVIVPVGANGQISLFNAAGSTDVIADVEGYFSSQSTFTPIAASRILDTRAKSFTIDSLFSGIGAFHPASTENLQVAGRAGMPATGVGSIVMNVTATNPTAAGYLTAWPAGISQPLSSNLNFVRGQTIPNLVITAVGSSGQVSMFNSAGQTDYVADAVGWFPPFSELTSVQPARLLDTRSSASTIDRQYSNTGALKGNTSMDLLIAGRGGVPTSGASAVILNVTATNPTAPGFLTVWPSGSSRPNTSNLNVVSGQTVANLVIAEIGANGKVSVYNSAGSTDVIADIVGWF